VQGQVVIRALITKTGELTDLKVVSGDPILIPAALEAVRQWRYSPPLLNSEPLEIKTTIVVPFTLNR
jgi:protein TonB